MLVPQALGFLADLQLVRAYLGVPTALAADLGNDLVLIAAELVIAVPMRDRLRVRGRHALIIPLQHAGPTVPRYRREATVREALVYWIGRLRCRTTGRHNVSCRGNPRCARRMTARALFTPSRSPDPPSEKELWAIAAELDRAGLVSLTGTLSDACTKCGGRSGTVLTKVAADRWEYRHPGHGGP